MRTLPAGYQTRVSGDGANLSAGEKQLITIARAFLSQPQLLILDEATSSVDTRTEALIAHATRELRQDRTSFIIAHRLSTIRDADRILVVEAGKIVEQGNHAELLARRGAYYALTQAQLSPARLIAETATRARITPRIRRDNEEDTVRTFSQHPSGTRKGPTMKFNKIATLTRAATLAAVAGAMALGLATEAQAASGTMYGNPAAAAKFWHHQQYDDCVLMSSADVVGEMTGKQPSEVAIIRLAESTPSKVHPGSIYMKPTNKKNPNSGQGTSFLDVQALLAHYGIGSKWTDADDAARTGIPTGMEALENFLGSGHKVIVSVNAEMIWHQPIETKDRNGNPQSDHAVVVTGVDAAKGIVHLNDSGNPKGRDEQIPMALFLKAWSTSHNFMVVTTGTGAESS